MFDMIRAYIHQNADWLSSPDPFARIGDMESEIAELRTMTRVTQLRKQIECRQEGSWVMVRDVPDDRAPNGSRKVTSYGRTTRSVTRSVSQNINFDKNFHHIVSSGDPVVEHPPEEKKNTEESKPNPLEITEVMDPVFQEELKTPEKQNVPDKPSQKKTSVVTLGKGNLVLINPEDDTNFHVTGISKGKVADAVSTLERATDKKVKKVGFCKTEVHFAPDSGKINIVETDEKPPPTQVYRKKKRLKSKVTKSNLPKHYFGDVNDFGDDSKDSNESDKEDLNVRLSRESSPLRSSQILVQTKKEFPTFEKTIKSEEKETKYRHSSPEKVERNFDVETIEAEERDFFKKLNQVPKVKDTDRPFNSIIDIRPNEVESRREKFMKGFDTSKIDEDILNGNFSINRRQSKEYEGKSYGNSVDDVITAYLVPKVTSSEPTHQKSTSERILNDSTELKDTGFKFTEVYSFFSKPDKSQQLSTGKEGSHEITEKTATKSETKPQKKTINGEYGFLNKKTDPFLEHVLDNARKSPSVPIDQDVKLGIKLDSVSPKLKNLIQNSVEHEFQLRQKQILQRKSLERSKTQASSKIKSTVSIKVGVPDGDKKIILVGNEEPRKSNRKAVTQVNVCPDEPKHEFQTKREKITKNLFKDPISERKLVIKDSSAFLLAEEPTPKPRERSLAVKEPPKPKPRTLNTVQSAERVKNVKPLSRSSFKCEVSGTLTRQRTGRPKETVIRVTREGSEKNYAKSTLSRDDKCKRRVEVRSGGREEVRKGREPLRSFEKVSNGWVGHTMAVSKGTSEVRQQSASTPSSRLYSTPAKPTPQHSSGSRRPGVESKTTTGRTQSITKPPQQGSRSQFSLSREHLRSARLVKEVSPKRSRPSPPHQKVMATVKPRVVADKKKEGYGRLRRDSEQSDDSIVRADEEVRAYMFKTSPSEKVLE